MPLFRAPRSTMVPFRSPASGQSWAVTAAATDFANSASNRCSFSLAGYTQARLTMRVNGVGDAGSIFKVQYSTDESTWADIGCTVPADASNLQVGSWVTIPEAARTTVNLRLVGIDGAATINGSFANIFMEVR